VVVVQQKGISNEMSPRDRITAYQSVRSVIAFNTYFRKVGPRPVGNGIVQEWGALVHTTLVDTRHL
jgi:hypothetical protein